MLRGAEGLGKQYTAERRRTDGALRRTTRLLATATAAARTCFRPETWVQDRQVWSTSDRSSHRTFDRPMEKLLQPAVFGKDDSAFERTSCVSFSRLRAVPFKGGGNAFRKGVGSHEPSSQQPQHNLQTLGRGGFLETATQLHREPWATILALEVRLDDC